MARKAEPGITYYPVNVEMIHNKKVKLLFNEFDSHGFWIYSCLLSEIYKHKGYYIDFSDSDTVTLFATDVCKKPVSVVDEAVLGCVRRGLFNKTVFDMFKILTSDRIQENYLEATYERRRKGTEISLREDLLLIPFDETWQNVILTRKNEIDPRKNGILPHHNPQSKVKESKVKESKGESGKNTTARTPDFLNKIFEKFKVKIPALFPKEFSSVKKDYDLLRASYQQRADDITYSKTMKEEEQKQKLEKLMEEFQKKEMEHMNRKEGILRKEIEKFINWYFPRGWKLKGGMPITDETCIDVFTKWLDNRKQFAKT
jgi:hypothetical protein